MISLSAAGAMALVALAMVLTPGPNMIYLASRSISQGRMAGLVSLVGVAIGFVCYLVATVAGLSSLIALVPWAYTVVKVAGALYLGYLAVTMVRPGGSSPFSPVEVALVHTRRRLMAMGLVTNLLNPKIALMYAALLPQFVRVGGGPIWSQVLQLGLVQIAVALTVNALIVVSAAAISERLHQRPRLMLVQRLLAGGLLASFAIRLLRSRPAL